MERSLIKSIAAGVARLHGKKEDSHVSPHNHVVRSRIGTDGLRVSPHNHVATKKLLGIFPFAESFEPLEPSDKLQIEKPQA